MLKGQKCYLTSVEESSIETLRNWRNNPELRKYFREYREINKSMQKQWYENRVLNNQNQVDFEIHDVKTEKLIGHCGLYYINWVSRSAEFTVYIGDFDYRGKGIGKDALITLFDYGFKTLNLHRIWCEVYSNNKALGVYEHIGFKKEGVMRETYYNAGQYWDSTILSMLSREWTEKYGT
jgi:hypothetical protein